MFAIRQKNDNWLQRASVLMDDVVGIVSPQHALKRKIARFGYDILDKDRLRRKRSRISGTGDSQLSESDLARLRDISRDLGRNNPLFVGLLRKEANGVVGTATQIQARTDDAGWNQAAEQLWKEEMIERPCEVTGRFNIHAFIKMQYKSYRRDGDSFALFTDEGLQGIEGEQCGTPYGKFDPENFTVTNGVAVSKKTQKVIGYYIGKPNKWGYIQRENFQNYRAEDVQHVFNPERFSYSRGEPVLVSAVDIIDKLWGYVDAELVAAKINACFPMMVKTLKGTGLSGAFNQYVSTEGINKEDEYKRKLLKIEPGQIWEGEPGDEFSAIGQTRPAAAFDPFVMRLLAFIGNPMCMALMLVTGDFSGATFMNARIAYQEVRDNWRDEQELVIKPFVRRTWLWKLRQWIENKQLTEREDWARHEIFCKRWPYVDPFRESQSDKIQLENGTTNRTAICARHGDEFNDITEQRDKEEKLLKDKGIELQKEKQNAIPK